MLETGNSLPERTNTVLGILAHVDAGKTTLSEGILYLTGQKRTVGRVDKGDTTMDSHHLEKERGITIFSSHAQFPVGDRTFSILDTPGHVDFSAEMERTLSVLDGAILLISGTDGVQAHTRTLWRLLSIYRIPAFIFVTKMDYGRYSEEELLAGLREELSEECVPFGSADRDELAAMCDEKAMEEYLENGKICDDCLSRMVLKRQIFPVYFGSGLQLQGINELLAGLSLYLPEPRYPETFGARVFKVTHDSQGAREVHVKITGGVLSVRDQVAGSGDEKVSRIRTLAGEKSTPVPAARAGDIVALSGLSEVKNGWGLGFEKEASQTVLEPVMRYSVVLPEDVDPMKVLPDFRMLEDEDPALRITWDERLREIQAGLMGDVQAEILKSVVLERFGLSIEIGKGRVLYRETIRNAVEGVGHYEPLRHYAEVHLLLEPGERGTGIRIRSNCREEILEKNYQHLVLTNIAEKEHLGVLCGFPLTDVKITLMSGRAHLKHTEGGDFRQAVYRAVRQGLMQAESVLLEPWYRFRLEIPAECMSRAMNDIRDRFGESGAPVYYDRGVILTGRAPASSMNDYAKTLASYSSGLGRLFLESDGYDICHDPEVVKALYHYEPTADLDNTPDSVFCAHGGGFRVPWDEVEKYMHLPSIFEQEKRPKTVNAPAPRKSVLASDRELEEIMLREFGPIRRAEYREVIRRTAPGADSAPRVKKDPLLIVDGYNVIFAWEELRELSGSDIQAARDQLIHVVQNYAAYRDETAIIIFDGYRVPGSRGAQYELDNITVIYTKERESADLYMERLIGKLGNRARIRLVTSDGMIQLSALRSGIARVSSGEFLEEVLAAEEEIRDMLAKKRLGARSDISGAVRDALKEETD